MITMYPPPPITGTVSNIPPPTPQLVEINGQQFDDDGNPYVNPNVPGADIATDTALRAILATLQAQTSSGPSSAVTVTNFPPTQAVSAASLPLPAGAATAALQTAIATILGTPMQQTGGSVDLDDGLGNPINSLSAGPGANALLTALTATNYIVSTNNSSIVQLAAGATFSGAIETVFNQPEASILLLTDQPGILTVNQYITSSPASLCASTSFAIAPTSGGNCFARSFVVNGNFLNITFKNIGLSPTTTLNLTTSDGTIDPATQLLNAPVALNEINGTTLNIGQQAKLASLPVALASDQNNALETAGQLQRCADLLERILAQLQINGMITSQFNQPKVDDPLQLASDMTLNLN
jgi:hypothetical protein